MEEGLTIDLLSDCSREEALARELPVRDAWHPWERRWLSLSSSGRRRADRASRRHQPPPEPPSSAAWAAQHRQAEHTRRQQRQARRLGNRADQRPGAGRHAGSHTPLASNYTVGAPCDGADRVPQQEIKRLGIVAVCEIYFARGDPGRAAVQRDIPIWVGGRKGL